VVSASKYSREVEVSKSRGAGDPEPTATVARGPEAGSWRRAHQRLDSSTSRLQNQGNKARMSMKTKDEYKKPGSADRRFCGLRLFHGPLGQAADRKFGGPRYTRIGGTKRECLSKQRMRPALLEKAWSGPSDANQSSSRRVQIVSYRSGPTAPTHSASIPMPRM